MAGEKRNRFNPLFDWSLPGSVQPKREVIETQAKIISPEDVWDALDDSVKDEFGRIEKPSEKRKRAAFLGSLRTLLDQRFKFMDLIKITPECVLSDGCINLDVLGVVLEEASGGGGEEN